MGNKHDEFLCNARRICPYSLRFMHQDHPVFLLYAFPSLRTWTRLLGDYFFEHRPNVWSRDIEKKNVVRAMQI